MKISIVTCTLNSAAYLPESINSVLSQTHHDIEYIFVDGDSTDGTLGIISAVPVAHQVIHGIRGGISNAMNTGAKAATGDIVVHLHSDDYLTHPKVFETVSDVFQRTGCRWGYGRIRELREGQEHDEKFVAPDFSREALIKGNFIPHPATYLARSVFEEVGYFDTRLKYAMDYDLWLRVSKIAKPFEFKEPLAVFRRHEGSLSSANAMAALAEDHRIRIQQLSGGFFDRAVHEARYLRRKMRLAQKAHSTY